MRLPAEATLPAWRDGGRGGALPLSLALHGAVVAALALATARPGAPRLPERPMTLVFAAPDAPAPAQPAATAPQPATAPPPPQPRPPAVSATVPDAAAHPPGRMRPTPAPRAAASARPSPATVAPAASSADTAREAAPRATAARPVAGMAEAEKPVYPLGSVLAEEQGLVVLHVEVGADGRASAATVAHSSGHARLDDAARRTVATLWRFVPATVDGQPVPGAAEVPITFRLER